MKSYKYLLFITISLLSLSTYAQTSKKTLNYQAVILDPKAIDIPGASITGQPLNKGNVCLRFSLLNAQGGLDYEETQQVTTDEYGLVNVAIGAGAQAQAGNSTSIYKSFDSVLWNSSVKSLKVSVSYDGCSSFKQVSAQALNYTPYALYAEAVDYKNVREAPTKLSQFSNDAGYLIPKDLDPLKSDIQTNSSKIEVANKSIVDNKQASEAAFLVVNQSISSLDTKVAENTTAIKENTSSITNINTKITNQQNQINDNRNQISATNNNLNTQIGGLQGQLNTTNSTVNSLSGVAEVVSNKSTAINLGGANPSDQAYPSQKAAKAYIDNAIYDAVGSGVPDATTLAAGKVKLAGDLGGTAMNPTVPALANKENTANKSLNVLADGTDNTKYPSVKAVKDYVDQATMGTALQATVDGKADKASPALTGIPTAPTASANTSTTQIATTAFVQAATAGIALQAAVDGKADKISPTFTGTPTAPTPTLGDNSTKLATTAYVDAQVSAGAADATTTSKGIVKLTGDLGGTATSPTVPGLLLKEDVSNKSNAALGISTTLYPTQNAVKTYVDSQVASATIVDADATTRGKIQLAGDLAGTATAPTVPGLLLKEDVSNKSNAALGTSATLYPTQNAVKTYVDAQVASGAPDATSLVKGKIALSGDLAGTNSSASAPVISDNAITSDKIANLAVTDAKIVGVAGSKVSGNITGNAANVTGTVAVANGGTGATSAGAALTALGAQSLSNLSTDISNDAASLTKYPAVKSIKDYVDASVTSGAPDATLVLKGKIALGGDLAGTNSSASAPVISDNAITSGKIANLAVIDAKIAGVAGSKVSGNITGNSANVTGTVTVANGGTGSTSLTLNNVLLGNGASALQVVAPGATGNVLTSNGTTWSSSAPQNSANTISGVVPVANGGTGLSSVTNGGAVYATSSSALATGTLPLTAGGTGATTATAALTALGAAPLASPTFAGTVTAPIYASAPQNLTDAATISWNPASGLNANVTLGGNRTLFFSTAPASGSYGTLVVTQDATGGRTLTLPSGTNKVLGSTSTTTISLSAAANAKDILNFYFDGTTYFWNIGQGYGTAATITANNIAGGAAGSLPYQTGTGATGFLAKGTDGQILTLASGVPSWSAAAATGVTSVAMTTPTGLSISGSPITSSGTLALSLTSGYAIPTNTSQTNWDAAYTNRITSAASPLSITSNGLSLGTVPVANGGTGVTTTPTNGQILIGNGTGFALATLTQGSGISITNTSGSILIAAAVRPKTEQFTASASQTIFDLAETPLNGVVWMFINGVRTNNLGYSLSSKRVTYNSTNNGSYIIVAGDLIQFDYAY